MSFLSVYITRFLLGLFIFVIGNSSNAVITNNIYKSKQSNAFNHKYIQYNNKKLKRIKHIILWLKSFVYPNKLANFPLYIHILLILQLYIRSYIKKLFFIIDVKIKSNLAHYPSFWSFRSHISAPRSSGSHRLQLNHVINNIELRII